MVVLSTTVMVIAGVPPSVPLVRAVFSGIFSAIAFSRRARPAFRLKIPATAGRRVTVPGEDEYLRTASMNAFADVSR